MPFSERQKELIEKHLFPDETYPEQPTTTLKLTRREVRFLVEAVQHFHESCCPGDGKSEQCAMLIWGENVHSGAIERNCDQNCVQMIDKLLSDEVLANFPSRTEAGH